MQSGIGIEAKLLLRDKHLLLRLQLPGRLLFLFRIRFGLYAVLARIGTELDWQKLEAEMAAAPFSALGGGGARGIP